MAIGDFFKKKKMNMDEPKQETVVLEQPRQDCRLAYKTRGDASPRGKQKVYFCCHPKDQRRYFDEISEQILQKQNCAIWYDANPQGACDEEFLESLSQMQMFVIPVTSAFLAGSNKALDVEFAYAMEHHIPVLPLLQETKIVNLFNRKCGDLQFLNAREKDLTVRGYEEKLEHFLQTVLVGDELAQKIRQAFDAYIFLSYRKKDRKYAQELMELIHRQPLCRDVAVWYDEFLVPGEDFTDSIQGAIKKCNLFAMAVTPNLLKETNYVMTTEFPLACQEQKPILAVEMMETDRHEFDKYYVNQKIFSCKTELEELKQELESRMNGLGIRQPSQDPQHMYLIGLAYLGGIDVEVNYDRAVELIKKSAAAGYSDAVKKLVYMYQNGEGVKRDYDMAIQFQKQLTNLLNEEPQGAGSRYLYECCQLGDMLAKIQRKDEAKGVYLETISAGEKLWTNSDSWDVKAAIAESHRQLGNLYRYDQEFANARKHCEEFYKLSKQCLQEREDTKEDLSQEKIILVASIGNLAELARDEENLELALDWYQQALEILEELSKETDYIFVRRNLAVVHANIGEMLDSYGDLFVGREHYVTSNKILEKLLKEFDRTDIKRDYQIGMDCLASSYLSEGDCRTAEKYAQKSLKLAKELAAETESLESKINLGISYNNLARIASFAGNKPKAMEYVAEVVELKKEIDVYMQ